MSISVGGISIDFRADVAQLTRDVQQAKGIIGGMARDVDRVVGTMKLALGSIGAGLSIAGIIAFSKSTIDAIARMKELGDEAGTSASAISKFEAPARAAGSSLDSVATAMFRMSKAALEARDPSSNAAQALASIGISATQLKNLKPDEMFELIARQLDKYSDGVGKNAVMQTLFNKSGAEMNRVMKEIAEKGQLTATVTEEEARQAKELNNQLLDLKMNSEKAWRSIASEGVPAMNDLIKAFIEGKKQGGLLNGVIAAVALTFEKMSGGPAEQLVKVNKEIAEFADSWAKNVKAGLFKEEDLANSKTYNDLLQKRIGLQKVLFDQALAEQDKRALAVLAAKDPKKPDPNYDPAAMQKALAFAQQLDALLDRLKGKSMGFSGSYIKDLDLLAEGFKRGKLGVVEFTIAWAELIADQDGVKGYFADLEKWANAYADSLRRMDEENRQALQPFIDQNKTLDQQIATYGQAESAVTRYTAAQLRATAAIIEAIPNGDLFAERMRAQADALEQVAGKQDLLKNLQDQVSVWNQLGDAAGRFLTDVLNHTKTVAQALRDIWHQFFNELIALFAKRLVLQLGASFLGVSGVAGSALANAAGSAGAGTLSGGALGSLGGVGAGISDFSSGLAGTYTGSELGGSVLGELGSTFSTALMAIPVWGQILAAVIAVGAILASMHKGGPKTEGQFVTGGAAGFNIVGTSANDQAEKFALAIQQGFQAALKAFGGTSGAFQFGAGIVRDPQGTSPTFLDTLLRTSSGQELFRQHNANVGRSDEDLQAEMTLQTQRVILAALQNSTLPPLVSGILNSITAATASADEINAAMTAAQNAQTMWNQFEQAFSTDAEKLATAQTAVTQGFAALGIAAPKSSADFAKLVRGLDLSTESGRNMFEALMQIAPAFKTVEEASTAAANAMKENWDAVQTAIDTLTGRNRGPGQLQGLVSQFEAAHSQFGGMSVDDLVKAFTTITEDDFAKYSAADQALIRAILELAATLTTSSTTISTAVQGLYNPPATSAQTLQEQFSTRYSGVIGAQPDQMSKLSLQVTLMQQQVATWQAQADALQASGQGFGQQYNELLAAIASFQAAIGGTTTFGGSSSSTGLVGQIAQLTILTAQYGQQKAEQLLALQQWYAAQQSLIGANSTALDALKVVFDQKWKDIVDGIASSDALTSAKAKLAEWWGGLFLNQTLSPLSLQQRFAEAQKQYQSTLALAQGGDVNAIGNLSGISQTLLELARQLFASSPAYTALFRQIAADTGGVAGISQADINSRLYSSLPTSGTLATGADIASLRDELRSMTTTLVEYGIKVNSAPTIEGAVDDLSASMQPSGGLFTAAV